MTEACLLLLQHGAVIDAPTGRPHKTTLHIAVAGGHLDLLKILVKKYKADWKVTDDWGWTALHEAAVRGHTDIIRFLMKECRDLVNQKDKLGRTPLLLGLLSGIDEVVTSNQPTGQYLQKNLTRKLLESCWSLERVLAMRTW